MILTIRWQTVSAAHLVLLLSACGRPAESNNRVPATPVRIERVHVIKESERIVGSGIVAFRAEMNLAFKVAGYIEQIFVEEGQHVRAGQVLARLQMTEADAQVRAAEAQSVFAARNLARLERLFADSVVTESRLDEARDAAVRAQAALDVAQYNQTHATIRAPAAGRILRRMQEVSEFSDRGSPVLRFGATDRGWIVRLRLPDRQVVRLGVGDEASVTLAAFGGVTLTGTVGEIADAADSRSGTFEVEIGLNAHESTLRTGMIAQVEIRVSQPTDIVYLSPQALVDPDGLDAAVFVLEGDTVRRHPVRVLRIGAEKIGVDAPGLDGAFVVTDGAAYLRDGDRVDVRPVEPSSSTP